MLKDHKHVLNTTAHSQNTNKSTLKYYKKEFSLQYYLIFIPLTFHSTKTYKSQHDINIDADDITITASHTKHLKAQQLIQPYLYKIHEQATCS